MKRLLLFLLLIPSVYASLPNQISVDGTLTDKHSNLMNGNYGFTFYFYDENSNLIWSEISPVNVNSGRWFHNMGSVNPLNLSFNETYQTQIDIDSDIGSKHTLTEYPYCHRAQTVADNSINNASLNNSADYSLNNLFINQLEADSYSTVNDVNAIGGALQTGATQNSELGNVNSPYASFGTISNFLLQSEQFGTTWYTINNTNAVTNNNYYSPRPQELIAENITGGNVTSYICQNVTNSSNGTWTFSVWLKGNGTVNLSIHTNCSNCLWNETEKVIPLKDYWNKEFITTNITNSHLILQPCIRVGNSIMANISAWGAQLNPTNINKDNSNLTPYLYRTTAASTLPISAYYINVPTTIYSTLTTSGLCSCVAVAAGGAITGATTGAFSSSTTFGGTMLNTMSGWDNRTVAGLGLINLQTTNITNKFQNSPFIEWIGSAFNDTTANSQMFNFTRGVYVTNGTPAIGYLTTVVEEAKSGQRFNISNISSKGTLYVMTNYTGSGYTSSYQTNVNINTSFYGSCPGKNATIVLASGLAALSTCNEQFVCGLLNYTNCTIV